MTIKFDTKILSELKNPSPDIHPEGKGSRFGFGVVIIGGQRLTVEGLTLTDVNNHRPASNWTNTLSVGGKHNLLRGVNVTSRGSFPYGYGDLLGKGAVTLLPLNKHSAVSAHGNKNVFVDCTIHARSFGHALGTENTQTFIGCQVDARTRRTDAILEETSGPAYEHDFKNVWTEEKIQPGYVISLSEDSFRSYGRSRGQGHTMKILGCSVRGTRTGIALSGYGNEMFVSNTTVRETVLGAVRLSNNARVVNVRADLRYGPALFMRRPRKNCRVDITLVPSEPAPPRWRVQPRAAAVITGSGHKIRFGSEGELSPQKRSFPIVLGHKKRNHGARNVQLINATGLPVTLTENTRNCRIITSGKVTDEGQNNEVVRTENPASFTLEDL